ncbi:hypothetical protein [Paraburkholderia sp. HD33-4]|uniref:hypothetical protein n=1 Tax=Paraburkholderia sp. HD33-4 TaxID=2883242 RepID=UPI001F24BF2A|nr:hypothetical protein [Paraburkholderia sp. HD33-4]
MDEIGTSSRPVSAANVTLSEGSASAVTWSAIIAGAAATAAFSLILLTLGSGLGLASISPWAPPGENATRFGFAAVIWICVTQILTSGLGGYLAGRLRKRWISLHVDETYFRDTAHGFLSWAVATLVTAALLTSAISGLFHTGTQVVAAGSNAGIGTTSIERGNAAAAGNAWPIGYFVDSLFRQPAASAVTGSVTQSESRANDEVLHIFLNSVAYGDRLSADDSRYVGQLVARRTGLSQDAAQARVDTTYALLQQKLYDLKAAAKDAAEKARKAAVYAPLWLFVSLLMGAFSASLMATFGGRQRDL